MLCLNCSARRKSTKEHFTFAPTNQLFVCPHPSLPQYVYHAQFNPANLACHNIPTKLQLGEKEAEFTLQKTFSLSLGGILFSVPRTFDELHYNSRNN